MIEQPMQKTEFPRVSVIIPVYNVEKYLTACVKSIQNQTLSEIEIVLVDDGSPDKCGELADKLALEDTRIRVIHRQNGGLGAARNSGLAVAAGEYVSFVDSDDWIDREMLASMYSEAIRVSADIVFSGMRIVKSGTIIDEYSHPFSGRVLDSENDIFALRQSFYGSAPNKTKIDPVPVSVCSGLYSMNLIKSYGLKFKSVRSEDIFFNTVACRAAKRVSFVSGAFYNYRKDDQPSITSSDGANTTDSYLDLFNKIVALANEEEFHKDECLIRAKRFIVDNCRVLVSRIQSDALPKERVAEVERLASAAIVRFAVDKYPSSALPMSQQVFFWALKACKPRSMLILSAIRGLLPLNGNRGHK